MTIISVSAGNGINAAGAAYRAGFDASLGVAGDALLFDGCVPIQYIQAGPKTVTKGKVASTVGAVYCVPRALRRQVSMRQVWMSTGRLRVGDAIFELARLELPITPKEGDLIQRGAERWDVIATDDCTHGSRWRVYARMVGT